MKGTADGEKQEGLIDRMSEREREKERQTESLPQRERQL